MLMVSITRDGPERAISWRIRMVVTSIVLAICLILGIGPQAITLIIWKGLWNWLMVQISAASPSSIDRQHAA